MKDNYALQLALSPSVTLFCLLLGLNWYPSIVVGFGAFYVSLLAEDLIGKLHSKRKDD